MPLPLHSADVFGGDAPRATSRPKLAAPVQPRAGLPGIDPKTITALIDAGLSDVTPAVREKARAKLAELAEKHGATSLEFFEAATALHYELTGRPLRVSLTRDAAKSLAGLMGEETAKKQLQLLDGMAAFMPVMTSAIAVTPKPMNPRHFQVALTTGNGALGHVTASGFSQGAVVTAKDVDTWLRFQSAHLAQDGDGGAADVAQKLDHGSFVRLTPGGRARALLSLAAGKDVPELFLVVRKPGTAPAAAASAVDAKSVAARIAAMRVDLDVPASDK